LSNFTTDQEIYSLSNFLSLKVNSSTKIIGSVKLTVYSAILLTDN